jgi:large subunit ribosomal protein L9
MKVILRKMVEKLGNPGDIVEVKRGYGSNFLLPHGLAFPATEANVDRVKIDKEREVAVRQKGLESAKALAERLANASLTVQVAVGEDEKMFGSVTSIDIEKVLEQEGIEVKRHDILLDEPIRELGVYTVKISLHPEVKASVRVWVVKK